MSSSSMTDEGASPGETAPQCRDGPPSRREKGVAAGGEGEKDSDEHFHGSSGGGEGGSSSFGGGEGDDPVSQDCATPPSPAVDGEGGEVDGEDELRGLAERIELTRLEDEDEAAKSAGTGEMSSSGSAGLSGKNEGQVSSSVTTEEEGEDDATPPTLRSVARWIQAQEQGTRRNVIVLSGAGVSCSAGIPDFRSPGTGLYDNLQKYNLPYPEAIFDLNFYRRNVDPFVSLASEIWPGLRYSPTLTHSFIALLDRHGVLLRNYTQNIDGLELLGGVTEERLVECHGHFRTAKCTNCFLPHDGEECRREMVEEKRAPRCSRCGGHVKPDIVFFGEGLPDRFGRLLRNDLEEADMIVVAGTSLTVAPVSMIPQMVEPTCRRVLLNNELVGDFSPEGENEGFYNRREHSDVFEEGDCDESILKLCKMLGWEDELLELNSQSQIGDYER